MSSTGRLSGATPPPWNDGGGERRFIAHLGDSELLKSGLLRVWLSPGLWRREPPRERMSRRFPNQEHYASYAGTAPIDVSSGDQETHRQSKRGNRQLNAASTSLPLVRPAIPAWCAITTDASSPRTRPPKEARRSLKRRLSNATYRRILADHQRAQLAAA